MVAVVAEGARPALVRLAERAANVAAEAAGDLPDSWSEAAIVTRATWDRAVRHRLIYTVVDVDPLAPVVMEWSRRLMGQQHELELAIGASNPPDPPDFYLVDEQLNHPLIDWYLGHLRDLSPGRVVPVKLDPDSISHALGSLGYGPSFPSGKELAASAREYVPLPGLAAVSLKGDASVEQMFD
jgi:hypothetical protein